MKTAKEWAESVVISGQDYGWAKTNGDAAREVVERLVERVQADARAPLEEQIARLRQQRETMEGVARRVLRIASRRVSALKEEIARLREERRRDIEAMDALGDCVSDNVWNELNEMYPTLVDSVNVLVQRINLWRAEETT